MDYRLLHLYRIKLFNLLQSGIGFLRKIQVFFLGGESCLCCGIDSGVLPLCEDCILKMKRTIVFSPDNRCSVCGKILVSEIGMCSACRNESVVKNVDGVFPLFSYRLWKKNLLFAWKTEEKRVLSPLFADFVYKAIIQLSGDGIPVVVPVPPRPGKIRRKGWDQIDELCFYLRNMYGLKILNVLRRLTKYQQKKLNREKRLEQIKKAYILKSPERIKKFLYNPPEKVVLIDDVMTTGSTIEACAEELKKAGVKTVAVITLFIVD